MAKKYLVALDLVQNELQNARVQNLAFAPGSGPAAPVKGQLFYNTTDDTLYWWNGSQWMAAKAAAGATPAASVTTQAIGDAGTVGASTNFAREDHKHGMPAFGTVQGQQTFSLSSNSGAATTVARSDHIHGTPDSGGTPSTQAIGDAAAAGAGPAAARFDHKHAMPAFANPTATTTFGLAAVNGSAATIARSDHTHGTPTHDTAAHSAIPLSALATPTADINFGGTWLLRGLGAPLAGGDAATKQYVDNLTAGLSWKEACRIGTTANVTQSGLTAIDGVTPVANDRILCKNQSTATQNGIWLAQSGAWTRALDADAVGELEGATVFIMEGTTLADTAWTCTTNPPITPGTTATTWVQFGAGTAITAGNGLTGTTTFDVVGDATIVVTADQIARAGITGDISVPAGSNTATLGFMSVDNDKLVNMASPRIKGRATAGTGEPEDLTTAQMKTMLGYPSKFTQATIGGATSQVVTHNLNTRDVVTTVYRTLTPWDEIECDVEMTSVNTITLRFAAAPAANEYSVCVIG